MTSFGLARSHFLSSSLSCTHTQTHSFFLLIFPCLFLFLNFSWSLFVSFCLSIFPCLFFSLDFSLSLFYISFLPFSFFQSKYLAFVNTSIINENITPYTTQEDFELTSKLFLEVDWNAFINACIIIIRWVEYLKSCWGSIKALCVLLRAVEYCSMLFEKLKLKRKKKKEETNNVQSVIGSNPFRSFTILSLTHSKLLKNFK